MFLLSQLRAVNTLFFFSFEGCDERCYITAHSFRSWLVHLQGSCTLAGAEMTRFVFTVPKLYRLNLYLELQHVSMYGSLQCKVPRDRAVCVWVLPGRDWHEAVAARCHLYPGGRCCTADIYHGGAGSSVRQIHTVTRKQTHWHIVTVLLFKKFAPRRLLSPLSEPLEKLTSCVLATPTCRELSQSDGATGS